MRIFASTRRDRCASCEAPLDVDPVYRMDEAYCCVGCADGGPCICLYEQDLADDGVDHLGMPFAMPSPAETEPAVPAWREDAFAGRRQ